ncbi:riboflavin synthase subunit beta [Spongiivirga sp. MCCC 1A20706]|uniref:riboflavin synthase subunit beta n=1 Tax=Spongiivirga sp. MCCC 1A20706 TaxID=3160963 RepID=UPI003977652B
MGRFSNLRKNKKYNYEPRYYDNEGEDRPFKMDGRFTKYSKLYNNSDHSLKGKVNRAMNDLNNQDPMVNRRIMIIVAILLFIFLYIIDFDLSIFSD